MEILPAPTGFFSTGLPSRRAHGNGTACTMRSGCSGHECRLYLAAACGGSLPSPQETHVQSTARRTDALPHTYPGFSSRCGHTFFWHSYLCHTSHNRCLSCSDAPDSTVHPSSWDSPDKHRASLVFSASVHLLSSIEKAAADFLRNGLFSFCHLNHIILPYCISIAFTANFQESRFFSAPHHGAGTLSSYSCSTLWRSAPISPSANTSLPK